MSAHFTINCYTSVNYYTKSTTSAGKIKDYTHAGVPGAVQGIAGYGGGGEELE